MESRETFSWKDRVVARRARHVDWMPRWARIVHAVFCAAFVGWLLGSGWSRLDENRDAGVWQLACGIAVLVQFWLLWEYEASLRLLRRMGFLESGVRPAATAAQPEPATLFVGHLTPADARRLARAPGYAEQLERLRWLHPAMSAVAVGAGIAVLVWADVPRSMELVLAALAGLTTTAAIALAAIRRWVRLVVALQRRQAPG